jgi:type II secretory pathway pseudopilin PulG
MPGMASIASDRGFTLLETVVATGILVTALAGIAQLFILSAHLTRHAGASSLALVAAQDKLESLRALPFGYDAAGVAITASALQPSPPNSLDADIERTVDWLDVRGEPAATNEAAAFVRRWRISTIAAPAPDTIAIEVCVFKAPVAGADHRSADACLSSLRTRQP